MRLLIITQVIDEQDSVLGFFCGWVREFAKHVEEVHIICLRKGTYNLPKNVHVYSLGKEQNQSRLQYLVRFYKYTIAFRNQYDSVFIHMNQIYAILGFPIWLLLRKKVAMWYAHGKVSLSLKVATWCVDTVFASTKEGFNIETKKLFLVGQGIDTGLFKLQSAYQKHHLVTVGRISRIKNLDTIVQAVQQLQVEYGDVSLSIVGDTISQEDSVYKKELLEYIQEHKLSSHVSFDGPKKHQELPVIFGSAHCFVNMSDTGSLDKTLLEALSCGVPVVSSNKAFSQLMPSADSVVTQSVPDLVNKVKLVFDSTIRPSYRSIVEQNHSLQGLVLKILSRM